MGTTREANRRRDRERREWQRREAAEGLLALHTLVYNAATLAEARGDRFVPVDLSYQTAQTAFRSLLRAVEELRAEPDVDLEPEADPLLSVYKDPSKARAAMANGKQVCEVRG